MEGNTGNQEIKTPRLQDRKPWHALTPNTNAIAPRTRPPDKPGCRTGLKREPVTMLCEICQDTIERAFHSFNQVHLSPDKNLVYDPKQRHHHSLKSLEKSISSNCYLCNLLWSRISPWAQNLVLQRLKTRSAVGYEGAELGSEDYLPLVTGAELFPLQEETVAGKPEVPSYWFNLLLEEDYKNYQFKITDDSGEDVSIRLNISSEFSSMHLKSVPADNPKGPAASLSYNITTGNTRSAEVFSLADRWISDCIKNHERCKGVSTEPQWYPTRLLDMGVPNSTDSSVYLIETKDTIPSGSYMTLSHCWGKLDHLKLTKKTYGRLISGLPVSSLRQVFQDAIHCAKSLNTRYLWIDALCIFQDADDLSDWKLEAPLMQDVYANSVCNISALDASDGGHSFYHSRDPETFSPPRIRIRKAGIEEEFVMHDYNFWQHEVSDAVLHTRAWVVQERLLAPRVLHFGKRQILWECAQLNAAEIYPDGVDPCVRNNSAKILTPNDDDMVGDEHPSPHDVWGSIVSTYTNCSLTKPGDKLIACAGLAKKMAKFMQGQYIAGLWRHPLEPQLLWEVAANPFPRHREIGDTSRPTEYRAPSWSWASINGPITLSGELENERVVAKVESVRRATETSDKYGAIRAATLRLRGTLEPIVIYEPTRASDSSNFESTWSAYLRREGEFTHNSPNRIQFTLDILPHNFHRENKEGLLFMMPILVDSSSDDSQSTETCRCLLLLVTDPTRGVYQRLGVATWERPPLSGKSNVENPEFPCFGYEDGCYIVEIL